MKRALVLGLILLGCGGDPRTNWVSAYQCSTTTTVAQATDSWTGTTTLATTDTDTKSMQLKATLAIKSGGEVLLPMAFPLEQVDTASADVSTATAMQMANGCNFTVTTTSGTATRDSTTGKVSVESGTLSLNIIAATFCTSPDVGTTVQGTYSIDCTPMH
jgi:hypothetical protein